MEIISRTGLRVSEIVELRIADLGSLTILPADYIVKRREWLYHNNLKDLGWLFVNRFGGKLSTRSFRRKFDKYVKIAGLNPAISPHTLRHTFAQHAIEAGTDIKMVSKALGHKNVATTKNMYAKKKALNRSGAGKELISV